MRIYHMRKHITNVCVCDTFKFSSYERLCYIVTANSCCQIHNIALMPKKRQRDPNKATHQLKKTTCCLFRNIKRERSDFTADAHLFLSFTIWSRNECSVLELFGIMCCNCLAVTVEVVPKLFSCYHVSKTDNIIWCILLLFKSNIIFNILN